MMREAADRTNVSVRGERPAWDEALAIVAHDLRSPLATIAMAAEVLAESETLPGARKARLLDAIPKSAQHAEQLVANYLEPLRVRAGRVFEMRPEDARRLLVEVGQALHPQAEARGVRLEIRLPVRLPVRLPPVLADGEQVRQVCWNLIGNAIKFTPAGGRVRVTVDPLEHALRIWVVDTGPGIAPAELPRICERYWQARPGSGGGIGLGLDIARDIIERHGDHIGAGSEVGQGTRIYFTLPLAASSRGAGRRHGRWRGLPC